MKLELPRGAFGGDKWIESFYTLDTPDWTQIGANGNFPGTLIEQVNFRIPSNDPSCPECGGIDPDLKPMKSQEAVFGLDHELNASTSVASGTPISRQVNMVSSLPVLYLGRESDGRLPVFSQTDLNLTQSVRLPGAGRTRVEVMLNILNLFDQDTATNRFASETRQNIPISDEDFFNGFDVQQLIQQFNITRDPRFLKDSAFQAPRAIRVGAKFSF